MEYVPNEGIRWNARRKTKLSGDQQSTNKEFKAILIKILKELRRRMDEQSEKLEVFNKELENIKKNATELKEYNNWNKK